VSTPAFVVQGQGAVAVLLLHGIGGGKSIWAEGEGGTAGGTASAIAAAGFLAVSIDFPGYGESAAMGPPDMDSLVAGVMSVLAAVAARPGHSRSVLLGHSMGGMVAQELLARHADAVQGLILACTSARFGKADGAWQQQFLAERLAPLDAGLGMAGMAEGLIPGLLAPQASTQARQQASALMSRVPEATYRAALQAIAGFDRRAALAQISVPTLLLAAEHDRTAAPELMQRMASRIALAEFHCLPAAGHIANVEQPAAFNAAVLSFLRRHFAPA